jgi:hypothetical protein
MDLTTLRILLGESCYNWHPYACGFFYLAYGPPTMVEAPILVEATCANVTPCVDGGHVNKVEPQPENTPDEAALI